jgi:hypothetical protein
VTVSFPLEISREVLFDFTFFDGSSAFDAFYSQPYEYCSCPKCAYYVEQLKPIHCIPPAPKSIVAFLQGLSIPIA